MSKLYEFGFVSGREFTEKELTDIIQIMHDVVVFYEKNEEDAVTISRGVHDAWAEIYLYGSMGQANE